ncbi:MAG: phosphatidylserine decarboxylase [Firmicutes bacterium]|nr:phosphatidylserine decarboxylase [Bacillota bacterium]
MDLLYYNADKLEREKVPANALMRIIYENPVGNATLPFLIKRKALSKLYGVYCKTKFSAHNVPKFIQQYNIDMTGCKSDYTSYSDFFSREKLVDFPKDEANKKFFAPCEGLVSICDRINPTNLIAAKGSEFSLAELFDDQNLAESYRNGTMVKIRLTPANYHRMHFFDSGTISQLKPIDGHLYSVNPIAVSKIARLYCQNKRVLIVAETANFGKVAIVEVGATFVGSIVHLFEQGDKFSHGEQASYFLPGGSLVILFFQENAVKSTAKILTNTAAGYETKISLGDCLGTA